MYSKARSAFSGRYDLTLQAGDFHSLFHGFYTDDLISIMPTHSVPLLRDRKQLRALRQIHFTIVIGEEDPFYEDNVRFDAALAEKENPAYPPRLVRQRPPLPLLAPDDPHLSLGGVRILPHAKTQSAETGFERHSEVCEKAGPLAKRISDNDPDNETAIHGGI